MKSHRWAVPAIVAATLVASFAAPSPASAADATDTPLVSADAGTKASDMQLGSDQQGGISAAALACKGHIDYPHVSGTAGVTYTINVHFDGLCKNVPSVHTIEGSLYRHRWYGWQHLSSGSVSKPKAKLRLPVNKGCTKGDWYRYRASGRFYAVVGKTKWSRSFYNENPDEIKCVRSAGASS